MKLPETIAGKKLNPKIPNASGRPREKNLIDFIQKTPSSSIRLGVFE